MPIAPIGTPSRSNGVAEHGPITMLWGAASSVIRSNRQEVMNMDRFTIDKRTTDHIIGESVPMGLPWTVPYPATFRSRPPSISMQ